MAEPTQGKTVPEPSTGKLDIDAPCKDCSKNRRILCIRARRRPNFGHADLVVVELPPDTTKKVSTFGNWPAGTSPSQQTSPNSTILRNYKEDTQHSTFKYVRCRELNEEQDKNLRERLNAAQKYDYTNDNCAKWAGDTWNGVMQENLDYGATTNTFYNGPDNLGDSMATANGGSPSNIVGSF